MHDLLNFTALTLSGVLGALLTAPAQRTFAVVKRRIGDGNDRR